MKRSLALLLAVLLVALAGAWTNYRARHELCLVVTQLEEAVARRVAADPAAPPTPAAPAAAAMPWLLHAGKPAPGYLPNSERSLAEAAGRAKAVEVDVAFSRDLVPYLSHEDDLGRLAGGGADRVSSHASAELDGMALADGTRPLRLAEFVRRYAERFELVVFDVKTRQDRAAEKARALVAALPAGPSPRVRVISLCAPVLSHAKSLRRGLAVGSETYGVLGNWLSGFEVLSARPEELTAGQDRLARRAGLERLYWTAHSPEDVARILAWSPDAIIVDLAGPAAPALPVAWRR